MDSIFDILNIDKEVISNFPLQANLVINHEVEKVVDRNVKRLTRIEQGLLTDGGLNVSPKSIKDVINRVTQSYKAKDLFGDEWTPSELRLISYNLSLLQNDVGVFSYAIKLLNSNWRNLFINGIAFYLINSWNLIPGYLREKVCNLLKEKLMAYKEYNKRYLTLKEHADLFEESGPLRLTMLLIRKSERLSNAPTYFGYKPTMISLSYFSDVIIEYVSKSKIKDLSYIENVFQYHDLDRTKKLLFANLVEDADKSMDELYKERVSRLANRIIGDVTHKTTWTPFLGATNVEKDRLDKARKLVNKWMARKFVEVFFDKCVQDPARKEFWLKYADFISDFKIAGSQATKIKLTNDETIGSACSNYFCMTSSKIGKTSALILYIRDKVFVEFSDVGSVYVYNKEDSILKKLGRMNQYKVEDLKLTSMGSLVITNNEYWESKYTLYPIGRLSHSGYWQDRLDSWFENILGIDPKLEALKSGGRNNQEGKTDANPSTPKIVNLDDVKVLAKSKLIFNGKHRIYADSGNFWLSSESGKLYLICKSVYHVWQNSSIWVKESKKQEGYLEITLWDSYAYTIGYIKKFDQNIVKFINYLTNESSYIFVSNND